MPGQDNSLQAAHLTDELSASTKIRQFLESHAGRSMNADDFDILQRSLGQSRQLQSHLLSAPKAQLFISLDNPGMVISLVLI